MASSVTSTPSAPPPDLTAALFSKTVAFGGHLFAVTGCTLSTDAGHCRPSTVWGVEPMVEHVEQITMTAVHDLEGCALYPQQCDDRDWIRLGTRFELDYEHGILRAVGSGGSVAQGSEISAEEELTSDELATLVRAIWHTVHDELPELAASLLDSLKAERELPRGTPADSGEEIAPAVPDVLAVPRTVLEQLVSVARYVSLGRRAVDHQPDGAPYPDSMARFALGALHEAGLLGPQDET